MTKPELIEKIAEKGYTKVAAKEMLEAVCESIVESILEGDPVRIPEMGVFEIVKVSAKNGRNPQTGEAMVIAAHERIKYKPAAYIKDMLKERKK